MAGAVVSIPGVDQEDAKTSSTGICTGCGKRGPVGLLRCAQCGAAFRGKGAVKQLRIRLVIDGGSVSFQLD